MKWFPIFIFMPLLSVAQNYTSYFTGNITDLITIPNGGICMLGGATENDEAMQWFLQQTNGGDVLVLRTSGSDGYNDYFYNQLGVNVNSVETIVFHSALAAEETYIHQKIAQAEAIWFAGGNQWNYISYWRGTNIDSLINDGLKNRNIVIGGTSAGMAILGSHYFTAENGTVTSSDALNNPFDNKITVDSVSFLNIDYLENIVTDSHYDNPNRKGRHTTFLAKMLMDYGINARGIACDEYTGICIDNNGIARAFGTYPTYDDNVYFLQVNCENTDPKPETYVNGQALDWNLGGNAVKVYTMKGNPTGSHTFDLNTWDSGTGGEWQNWFVSNGILSEQISNNPNCATNIISINAENKIHIFPNPVSDNSIQIETDIDNILNIEIIDINGKVVKTDSFSNSEFIDISNLKSGIYLIRINSFIFKLIRL